MDPLAPEAAPGQEPPVERAAAKPPPPPRKWRRRLVWALASGAVLVAVGAWSLRRPAVQQSIFRFIDGKVREETGLAFRADSFDLSPFRGRLVLHGVSVGGDLARASRLEVRADLRSLLGDQPHVRFIEVDGLVLKLDQARLARLHLKPRPPKTATPKLRLDDLRIRGASVEIRERAWGLEEALLAFDADGRGEGPNQLRLDLRSKALSVQMKGETRKRQGSISLSARISEERLALEAADLKLGAQQLQASGRIALPSQGLVAALSGKVDLAEIPFVDAGLQGRGRFRATATGTLPAPRWTLEFDGSGLQSLKVPLQPGTATLKARGGLDRVDLEGLRWASADGLLELTGAWRKGAGTRASYKATGLELGNLAERLRVPDLKGLRGESEGELGLTGDPWEKPNLGRTRLHATARFTREGASVGGLELRLEQGKFTLPTLQLRLPDLTVEGDATGTFGPKGLLAIQAKGSVATDVDKVAKALRAWKVTDLDMGGKVQGAASLTWSSGKGLVLDGGGSVAAPRWHGAIAEQLKATVQIRGDELYIFDIQVDKGEGRGVGDIWLTWADLPPGSTEMDMCFRAFRLPVNEGLKAADLGDLPIEGIASGWARLGGPFSHLLLTGDVRVEDAQVYGLLLPAVASNLELDLISNHLRLPEFRIAESQAQLYAGDPGPSGLLALRGSMDMDLDRGTWVGSVQGMVDSLRLGLPGPRLMGRLDASLYGPWTSPFGPTDLPTGRLQLTGLRAFLGQQSLEGLRADVRLDKGELEAIVGQEGTPEPLLKAFAWDSGGRALGAFRFQLSQATAGTSRLARRLTDDVLEDLDLDVSGSGAWDKASFRWEARSDRLEALFSAFSLKQTRPGHLTGNGSTAALDLSLEARDHAVNAGSAGIVSLTGKLPFNLTAPVSIHAVGTSEISEMKEVMDKLLDLDPYSLLADMRPEGLASMDLTLGGTLGKPTLDGTLNLDKGRLQVKSYPQSIEELSFSLRFEGRDIWLKEDAPLRGRLAQGDLRAWGKATWTPGDDNVPGGLSAYNLQARLTDFQLRDLPEGFEMQGDLEATLKGDDENGGLLKGVLRADRTLYRADINLADLLLSNTLGSTPDLSALDPDDLLSRIELDLDLRLSQPWQFDTNLLKLQGNAEGAFRVMGTLAKPGLKGKMVLVPGGRLTNLLPAGDIVIEQGTLDFVDPNTLDPVLNIQGRVDVPPYLVNLSLTGNLNQLSVSPTSTPSLRQEEIVSLLIDPATAQTVGTGSGTTTQSTLNSGLASASYGLISTLAFARFQENLRKTLGLDRVSFAIRTGSAGTLESNLILGKTFTIFDRRIPLLYGYRQAGEAVTHSGQAEWRIGNLVMQFGLSRTGVDPVNPTGEIRYTWSPRW
ncbi:MAG: translocation/assembly module TamB domain-containing protein [Holophagaceae bacterium]|nr:translocation/assembly module TamB domain-containing protein [Holophagaceae bacterium]